ncbi:MAG: hypothetical protein ABH834_03205 [Candidatus Altiarchaeota archaeon]
MRFRGQAAVEWLITHGWSILIVLSVGTVLFHLGVFDTQAMPRFEGLRAAGVQPVSDQVHLYSDGVLVLTVLNTRPYTMEVHWVEVSPIGDEGDVIRTNLNAVLKAGELGIFEVNASNIYSVSEALFFSPLGASAGSSYADFTLCIKEAYSAGGQSTSNKFCGTAWNIPVSEETISRTPGNRCTSISDCDLACELCYFVPPDTEGDCEGFLGCVELGFEYHLCTITEAHPEGECIPY